MLTDSASRFVAIHDQLTAFMKADVPVYIGVAPGGKGVKAMEEMGRHIVSRLSNAANLDDVLQDPTLPTAYCATLRLALKAHDPSSVLEAAIRAGQEDDDLQNVVRTSLRYPLLVGCVALAGLAMLSLFLVPKLEEAYLALDLATSPGLQLLLAVRESMLLWIPLGYAGLFGLWYATRRNSGRSTSAPSFRLLRWIPGVAAVIREQHLASFAETVATSLDSGESLANAIRDASSFSFTTRSVSDGGPSPDAPILACSLQNNDDALGHSRSLRMAARIYRESAARRLVRLRIVVPVVTCAVLGGGFTLLYGLALFLPVIEMLSELAN